MKRQIEFTEKDRRIIAREYADLQEIARKRNEEHMDIIQKAFEFSQKVHDGERSRSGDPYILHSICVAKIVVLEIGLGWKSVCAALLHDVLEEPSCTIEDVQEAFGEKIASLVDGLAKIKSVLESEDNLEESKSIQAENFKRVLLTLNDDARVFLIKLADRLSNCRTIEFLPEYKREKILSETMYIFIPLAHRLGLYSIKSEMENIWLRFKEPEAYNSITSQIYASTANKNKFIEDFLKPVKAALDNDHIDYVIKKRIKTPYSIWNKMKTKHVSFEQISDLYAVRIIFTTESDNISDERNECFRIFSLITAIYSYRPERVRDWVMHPKSNGYEALHLTVFAKDGTNIEIQIRTKRMDEIAEKGIAAHWNYKKKQPQTEESQTDKWIAGIKDILQNNNKNSLELLDFIHNDIVGGDIIVFDNRGNQLSIMKGSTVLDFAFLSNKEGGLCAIAAKVNYRLVPLSTTLKTGDQVEIITGKKMAAKQEWLGFLKTPEAISTVKEVLGIQNETSENAAVRLKLDILVSEAESLDSIIESVKSIDGVEKVTLTDIS